MVYNRDLADRIRSALADQPAVREVNMFGGLSFMVNGKMAVGANNSGDLLLRCDPTQVDELLAERGAQHAEMGKGRQMSKGWMVVRAEGIDSEEDFDYWIGIALEYNEKVTRKGAGRRGASKKETTR